MSATSPQRWTVDVSIVIPVFNKAELTKGCLDQLPATTRGVSHEVIVVDNASTDATPQLLAARSTVRTIRNEANRGFSGACNQGAAAARGKHLLFLNNDTVPLAGWLDHLVQEFRQQPNVAVVGSKLLYPTGLVQHAGVAFARESRSPFHPYRGLLADDPRVNRRRELQAVTAACLLIRRAWFDRCGGFSEDYRNGYEDLDLCLNIRRQGGLIVYQPKSTLLHLESQTAGRMTFDDANRALFFAKWADWLLADEDAYYLADDYQLVYRQEDRRSAGRLVRITSEADRRAWQAVATLQRVAAEGQWTKVSALVDDIDAWPVDAAAHRWAAAVAFRLNRRAAGAGHLRRSLELEPSPEALLQLAQIDSAAALAAIGNSGAADAGNLADDAAVRSQMKAVRIFAAGRFGEARDAFEEALVLGANAREALFGMASAALEAGDVATARQCCAGLLARRPADPLAMSLLERAGR
jgi:O-antigen biosynthesis protein